MLTGRETSHLVPTLLLPTLTVTGISCNRNLRLCQASSTQIAAVAELLAQLRTAMTPWNIQKLLCPCATAWVDQNPEPTVSSVTRTISKGSNGSSAGAVDFCSLPGLQPRGWLGGGQARCSGRSHSPPEEREIDFPEKKS